MAARKLQAEIDRTLKKVGEGVESFQGIYEKMQASTNQTQKEKQETELKTQIKKLQRMRDQIKSWVASSDIKDKTVLLEHRKLIETQMEKFKACEKVMKTKAFSKEGLTQVKLDPKAQERSDTISWLQSMVDELSMQTETAEAEVETLQGGTKRRGKGGGALERLDQLEHLNERRKWHVGRLELILRVMENGSLQTDKVLDIKEDVQYFVDSNAEEDYEEDEGIYDDLDLEEVAGQFGIANEDSDAESGEGSDDLPTRTPVKEIGRKTSGHDDSHHKREDHGSPVLKKSVPNRKQSTTETASRPSITSSISQQSVANVVKPPPTRAPTLPPMRYSAVTAGNPNAPQNSASNDSSHPTPSATQNTSSTTPLTAPPPPSTETPGVPPSPSLSHSVAMSSPVLSSVDIPPTSASRATPPSETRTFDDSPEASPMLAAQPAATSSPHRTHPQRAQQPDPVSVVSPPPGIIRDSHRSQANGVQPPPIENPQSASSSQQAYSNATPTPLQQVNSVPQSIPSGASIVRHTQPNVNPIERSRPASRVNAPAQQPQDNSRSATTEAQSTLPSSLSDLLVSFEGAKQKAATRMNDLNHIHKILEAGYPNIPQPRDTSKPKYYVPRHPYQTPAYYPQAPHPALSTPSVFSQLDVETLFYVFYYLPGTYQQYLAAKELKKQSWRFHVKYLTWFQRHSEPQAITEEYEQGVYVYFDWEGSWCQRKKSDFRFEYRYLSED